MSDTDEIRKKFIEPGFGETEPLATEDATGRLAEVIELPLKKESASESLSPVQSGAPEQLDSDPTPAHGGPRPAEDDIRDAISQSEGEVALAKHDFARIADTVLNAAGVVKRAFSAKEPANGWKTHGETSKKASEPMKKDRETSYKPPVAVPGTNQSDPRLSRNVPRKGLLK